MKAETDLMASRLLSLQRALEPHFGKLDEDVWRQIGPQVEWVVLKAGETLFREGDVGNSFYLVLSGRLAAKVAREDELVTINEIGRGEPLGEMSLLNDEPRSATIIARRDSILAKFSKPLFDQMLLISPNMVQHLLRNLATRLRQAGTTSPRQSRYSAIAVLPLLASPDADNFCRKFTETLSAHEASAWITRRHLQQALETSGPPVEGEYRERLNLWFDEQAQRSQLSLFQADVTDAQWTQACLRHADVIILLAKADDPAELTAIERQFLPENQLHDKKLYLILLHDDPRRPPTHTANWLQKRCIWRHFHLCPHLPADMQWIARCLQGREVGLVMAGGAARGLSHFGIYKALVERGIPIDHFGGTSAGAIMAGILACHPDPREAYETLKRMCLHNPTKGDWDWLPFVALMKGAKVKRVMEEVFGHRQIEDLWRPFFCVSANLTTSHEHVHTQGAMTKAIMASAAIPGIFPPLVFGNDLHVDGGIVNNLPIDVMRRLGVDRIIAADFERDKQYNLNYTEIPDSTLLLKQWFTGQKVYKTPSILSILMKSTALGSDEKARRLASDSDLFFRSDMKNIGFLDWLAFDQAIEIGYEHACEVLRDVDPAEWQ